MKIIVGLGNPGEEYKNTRHNAGFLALDKIREAWDFPKFKFEKKFNAEISKGALSLQAQRPPVGEAGSNPETKETKFEIATSPAAPRNDILLAKPQTLMNESGTAVKAMMDFYKLLPEDLVIIHDDTDIQFGKYKIAADSRSAGHKGVQNIIDNLGTQKFKRIRIGTGKSAEEKKECPISGHNYVLGKFSEEELKNINAILESLSQIIKNER